MIPDETELDYLSFYVDLPILLMHFLSHTTLSEAEKIAETSLTAVWSFISVDKTLPSAHILAV